MLQSSTALNDLVVASFLVAATYFLRRCNRAPSSTLGALALALALGTKFTALIALPLARARRPGRTATAALAAEPHWPHSSEPCAGSYWLGHEPRRDRRASTAGRETVLEQHPDRSPAPVLARSTRMLVGFADDLSGGRDLRLYGIAAVAFAVVVVAAARGRRTAWVAAAGIVAVRIACPLRVGSHARALAAGAREAVAHARTSVTSRTSTRIVTRPRRARCSRTSVRWGSRSSSPASLS